MYIDIPSSVRAHDKQLAGLLCLAIAEIITEILLWLADERLGRLAVGAEENNHRLPISMTNKSRDVSMYQSYEPINH